MALLLLAFFAQAVASAPLKSPTFDEPFHVARAYAYVRAGDLRMQQNHPPLVSALAGLPLLLMPELVPPAEIAGWDSAFLFTFADALFWRLGHNVDRLIFLTRFPIILLGTLLGAFIYRWAREMYGLAAGIAAAFLFAFSPNLLAHTRVVTTDLAVSSLVFIAFYAFWRTLREPTWYRVGMTGLAAGLALSAKLSALLLVPLFLVLALVDARQRTGHRWGQGRLYYLALSRCLAVFAIGGTIVWAFYGFEVRPWPGAHLPLPATTYLLNLSTLRGHAERGHGAFLMGQVSMHGWWYYFPVALGLKTPLTTLGLLAVAVWDTVRGKRRLEEAAVLLFPATYFGVALTSSLNIGFRYILPLVPFAILFASKLASALWLRPVWLRTRLLPAVLGVYAVTTLSVAPHYLAYFNVLAGGPGGGYRYLVDSNVDWGQDLKLLGSFLEERGVDEVWLGYFGTADPAYYGIRYRPIFPTGSSQISGDVSPFSPAPGWYAISATVLQGPFSAEPDILDWFRRQEPLATVGHSIFVFRVESDPDPPTWVGACYGPEPALEPEQIITRFGRNDLRIVGFDCRQTWVIPAGDGFGWYIVPSTNDGPGSLASEWLANADVLFRERGLRDTPGYTVYRWRKQNEAHASGLVARAWASPVLAPGSEEVLASLSVPVRFGDELEFLGYRVSRATAETGGEAVVTTAWRVVSRPGDPAVALFAHLVGPEGAVSVGDALGFPAIQWDAGDVFHQSNRLVFPTSTPAEAYWAQVGIYSLATGDRLPVIVGGEPIAHRVLLNMLWTEKNDHS